MSLKTKVRGQGLSLRQESVPQTSVKTIYKEAKAVQEKSAKEVESVEPRWGGEDTVQVGGWHSGWRCNRKRFRCCRDAVGSTWSKSYRESGLFSSRTLSRQPVSEKFLT